MKRRSFFPILTAIVASPFLLFQQSTARPITRRKRWEGQRKVWIGHKNGFDNPRNWEPYGSPRRDDTIVVKGGELTIPPGRKFKRLEAHEGIVTLDNDSCGEFTCFDEIIVHNGSFAYGDSEPIRGGFMIGEFDSPIEVK